jgi:DNA mismatch repair protein MutS2
VKRQVASDLDYNKVLNLVAAHARTGVGRNLVLAVSETPTAEEVRQAAGLSLEMEQALLEHGSLSFAGVDDALPWLDPAAPPPCEIADLLCLLGLARRIAALRRRLLSLPAELRQLRDLGERLPDTSGLVDWASPRLGRDGQVPDQASPELARLRRQLIRLRQQVVNELEAVRRSHGAAATDAPPTLRRDRYCIPVRSSARGQVSGLVLDSSGSGATVYLEPYSAVELNNSLVEAAAREAEEVRRIIDEVAAAFAEVTPDLAEALDVLAQLDAAQARVKLGQSYTGRIVVPGEGRELVLRGARHPLLDERLHKLRVEVLDEEERRGNERQAVPLDFRLPEGVRTLIISGPNAGGKTIVIKTIGLMVMMAYQGVPLPVEEGTSIPWFDTLWCHIGDEQSVADDLSTFSGTMASTASLLANAGEQTLVLFDELGAGTDPLEGGALGLALLEELTRRRCLTVTTTHLAGIAMSAESTESMDNAAMEYDEARCKPTYRLRFGRPGRSRALEIAEAMGVSEAILERARDLLGGAHLELDTWLQRLEEVEAEVLAEGDQLRQMQAEAERLQRRLSSEQEQLRQQREQLPKTMAAERERLRQRAKQQLDKALQELKRATREQRHIGRRRQQQLRDQALDLPLATAEKPAAETPELAPGMTVKVDGLPGKGKLQELRGNRALVSLAGKRLWVGAGELQPEKQARPQPAKVKVDTAEQPPMELMLLGLDTEAAREELEGFLDRALSTGCRVVRVVHGHGTGALRRVVKEVCRSHPGVHSFCHPPQYRGGTGATEVEMECHG